MGTSDRGLSEVPSVGSITSAKRSISWRSSAVIVTEPTAVADAVPMGSTHAPPDNKLSFVNVLRLSFCFT